MLKTSAARRRVPLCVMLGALIGCIAFFAVNTAASLDVTNVGWVLTGYTEKDILQHYTGWLFYRQSALGFPLGVAQNVNWPYGCAVTYTDSIPLFAIIFRFFSAMLPADFQYFGWYTLLCYLLQGASAALLLTLFTEHIAAVLSGTVLFVFSPILLERSFRHTALAAHFLLLFALYLYFANARRGFRYRWQYLALLALATTLHPYFLPMLFAVLFADLVQQAVRTRQWKKPLGFLLAAFAVVGATAYCIGIFSTASSGNATGYGYFCMNLNSLFDPLSTGGTVWSNVISTRPQGLGSADGFNYLGLGVLAALLPCAVLLVLTRRAAGLKALLRRHWMLLLCCGVLTVFAVSTTVLYCNTVLLRLSLPAWLDGLCSTFRSSGRLFWPVYYLIFLFVFSSLAQWQPKKAALRHLPVLLLAALTAVQVCDLSPALAAKRSYFAAPQAQYENPLQSKVWDELAGRYTHFCSLDETLYQAVYPAYYAAVNGMTTNDGFSARYDADTRKMEREATVSQLLLGQYDTDTLYVTSDYDTFRALARTAGSAAWAVRADAHWYLLIPKKAGVAAPSADENTAVYPDFPLEIVDYSDDNWTGGILNANHAVCAFYDDETTRPLLQDASALVCDGASYRILKKDYSDEGWVMVTLDIEDAGVLTGKVLTAERG